MRKLFQTTLLLLALSTSVTATAATPNDFYMGLLRRGAADVEAGRFNDALTPLRLAAFGLVETIDQYETALAYLAIALDRTGDGTRTREALQRILAAERVQRRFATLTFPPSIRASFDAVARKVLTSAEVASLSAATVAASVPTPSRPAVETPSRGVVTQPKVEQPRNVTTQPSTQPSAQPSTPPATKLVAADPKPTATSPQQQPAPTLTLKPPPPPPPPAQQQPQAPRIDVPARIVAAERALSAANLVEAKRIYRELLDLPNIDHATWIRIAEGLYRARDFAGTLTAFQRVGTLRPGEEAYRYYIAVAAFETGQFDRAKRELASALPYIEATTDVQRYRVKIEAAR
ncbi:MAG TPA: hypothetical protein VF883_08795 [Thermoanaerobaculia bacterium]|jgi:tetratricopeptide (TPR) repeat protein